MASVATDGETAKFVPPDAPYNGAFTKSLPIAVPAFFGLTPALSFNYNSGDTRLRADDGFSPLGVGWTLSGGSEISRVSKHGGTPAYSADDVFAIDGNALLSCAAAGTTPSCSAGGTHTTRFETYQRIIQAVVSGQTVWTATRRDGTVSTYRPLANWNPGGAQDARLRDGYRWLLAEVRDTDGNTVSYSYDCATLPACYVSAIDYGIAKVSFYWESRPDSVSFATGISVAAVSKRLKTVVVSSSDVLVRAYSVSYAISPDTKRSLLTSVQQFGSDASIVAGVVTGGTSLPPETFSYWDMSSRRMGAMISDRPTPNATPETVPSTTLTEMQSKLATVGTAPTGSTKYVFGDFNGDNETDLLVVIGNNNNCSSTAYYQSGQWSGTSNTPTGGPAIGNSASLAPINLCGGANGWTVGDFNGDGYDDLATVAPLSALTSAARTPWTSQGYKTTDAAIAVALQQNGIITGSMVLPVGAISSGTNAGLRNANQTAKMIVTDFNGDGKDDILRGSMFISSGTSLSKQTWANADWGRVGDFNGDGLSDLLVLDGANGTGTRLLFSTGSAFTVQNVGLTLTTRGDYHWPEFDDPTAAYVVREPATGFYYSTTHIWYEYQGSTDNQARASFKWNGVSGPPPAGYSYLRGAEKSHNVGEQTDNGHHSHSWTYEIARSSTTMESDPVRLGTWAFADLNGDGLTDALQVYESAGVRSLRKYLSTGSGLQQSAEIANLAGTALGNEFAFDLSDVNGDGVVELIRPNAAKTAYSIHRVADGYPATYVIAGVASLNGFAGDYNGDGKLDLKQAISAAPASCTGCIAAATDSVVPDLMKRNTLGTGGMVDLEYLPSTYGANGYLPMVLQVVSKITTSDGRGNSSATKFAYQNGAYDPFERKFLGFETVTAELPCEAGETSCPWIISKFRQEAVAAGSPKRVEVYAGNGALQRLVETGYVVNQTSAPFTAHKTSEQVTDYLVGGNVTTRNEWTYDGYANLLEEKSLGVVGSTLDDVMTSASYELNLSDYLVSYPVRTTVKDAAGAVLRDAQYLYDGGASISSAPTKGHVTTTRAWLNPGNRWIESTSSYDSVGNVITQVDPLSNRTEFDYDATGQFVIETRNPLWFGGDLRQKSTATWNALCGQPATSTDLNSQVTTFTYDALCRLTRVDYPTTDYQTTGYLNVGSATTQYIETARSPADGVTPIWSRTYLDGLGRSYKSSAVSADPAKPVVVETTYAKRGNPSASTAPYFQGDAPQWTTTKVDLLGRPTLVTLPDSNTLQIAYEAPAAIPGVLTVKSTDPLNRVSRVTTDAAGRDIRRVGYLGATAVTTAFTYNAIGEPVGVTDPNGNTWSNTYDTLGRRLTSSDPDLGTWTYAYDDGGRLTGQIDAKGQQAALTYDALGRVLTKTSGAGLPTEEVVTNTYDEARSGFYNVGSLTTAANDNAVIAYDYDVGTRPARLATTVDGNIHTVSSSFDAGGRLLSRGYPDGSYSGTFGYNAAGQAITLAGAITGTTYAPDGQIKTITYANGITTTYGYSATRGWLNSIVAANGATSIQSLTYTRDAAGRITGVAGGRADESWTYGYDALDRLLSAANTNTPSLSRSYTYDLGGNLTYNSAVGTYAYPTQGGSAFQPHAVTSGGVWTFGYDLNGNQTTRHTGATLDREITYDADNRPISMTVGGNTVEYLYGPNGARLKKISGASATVYLGDDTELDAAGGWTNYLTGEVKLVSGSHYFLLRDHQASVRAVTDNDGVVNRVSAFGPYGTQVETVLNPLTPTESKGYIGQRTDPESGLTYLHARYYDATLGRFLQPDWWDVRHPGVGTNRYAYSAGNPINLSDPGGHCNGSLLSDTCDGDEKQSMPSSGAVTLSNGRKVDPWFLAVTGQTGKSYYAALQHKAARTVVAALAISPAAAKVGSRAKAVPPIPLPRPLLSAPGPIQVACSIVVVDCVGEAAVTFACGASGVCAAIAGGIVVGAVVVGGYVLLTSKPGDGQVLFRGVDAYHPGYADALMGVAKPLGGIASAMEHVQGNTNSPYTSWTSDFGVAEYFATNKSGAGVVLEYAFPPGYVIPSPGNAIGFGESEYLVPGPVVGAKVIPIP